MRRLIPAALLACAALAVGCSRAQPEPVPPPPPAPGPADTVSSVPAPDAAAAPAAAVDCVPALRTIGTAIARMHGAMDGGPYYDQARTAWLAIDPACRAGRWHLHAAQLLRWRGDPLPGFASAPAALTAGLGQPADLELLVLVAFTGALAQPPGLPAAACDRARAAPPVDGAPSETADRVAYVCGHAALAAGEAARAEAELGRIANQRRYPDLPLRRAEVLYALGRVEAARPFVKAAVDLSDSAARAFGATDREHEVLLERARSLR